MGLSLPSDGGGGANPTQQDTKMLILGLDVETTGLDPEQNLIIEIGAVLWDVEKRLPVKIFSEMILEKEGVTVPPEIEELTGIETAMLKEFGIPVNPGLFDYLDWAISKAECLVAHNAPFDKGFLEAFYKRHGRTMPAKPWVCTVKDVNYPKHVKQKNLTYLAAVHGFVNPFSHRAVTDVLSMLRVLDHYDVKEALQLSQEPKIEVIALVSYDDRMLAKNAGFHWDGDSKQWKLETRKSQFDAEALGFKVEVREL